MTKTLASAVVSGNNGLQKTRDRLSCQGTYVSARPLNRNVSRHSYTCTIAFFRKEQLEVVVDLLHDMSVHYNRDNPPPPLRDVGQSPSDWQHFSDRTLAFALVIASEASRGDRGPRHNFRCFYPAVLRNAGSYS